MLLVKIGMVSLFSSVSMYFKSLKLFINVIFYRNITEETHLLKFLSTESCCFVHYLTLYEISTVISKAKRLFTLYTELLSCYTLGYQSDGVCVRACLCILLCFF